MTGELPRTLKFATVWLVLGAIEQKVAPVAKG